MSEWIEWKGGKQPVADHVMVEYALRDEPLELNDPVPAGELRWEHEGDLSDITFYRIVDSRSDYDKLEALRTAPRAESLSADFDGLTWTFRIAPDCRVGAGIYALVWVAPGEPMEREK